MRPAGKDVDVILPTSRRQARLLEPVLLLLILERDGPHGYELAEAAGLLALSGGTVEPAAVYRCLRWFEKEALVGSQWDTSGSGPARRCYFVTDLGLKALRLWADVLRRRRTVLDQFLGRYREVIPLAMQRRAGVTPTSGGTSPAPRRR